MEVSTGFALTFDLSYKVERKILATVSGHKVRLSVPSSILGEQNITGCNRGNDTYSKPHAQMHF